jgi:hypothetical protein
MSREYLRHKNGLPPHFAVDAVIYVAPNDMRNVINAPCIYINPAPIRPVLCLGVRVCPCVCACVRVRYTKGL